MPVRALIFYPSPELRRAASPIELFDSGLEGLVEDVRDTLEAVSAIGLTAPHIGILRRVTVIRASADAESRAYINPSILWSSEETETHDEGSVSMPGMRERVVRAARVRIAFQDVAGTTCEEEASGFAAAVLLHEIDQLDGIFWIDRLSRLRRDRLLARFAKAKRV